MKRCAFIDPRLGEIQADKEVGGVRKVKSTKISQQSV